MKMFCNVRVKRDYPLGDPHVYDSSGRSTELKNRTIKKGEYGTVIDRTGEHYLVEFCDYHPDENDPDIWIGWNIVLDMNEEDMDFENPDDKFRPWE